VSQYGASVMIQLIADKIAAGLPAALQQVSDAFPDGKGTYQIPQEPLFIFGDAEVYTCPAIFLVAKNFKTQKAQKGQNYIQDVFTVLCSCVVETIDDREALTHQVYRYQSALRIILDQMEATYNDGIADRVKIFCRVAGGEFSQTWTKSDDKNAAGAGFRKEIALELSVDHAENFS